MQAMERTQRRSELLTDRQRQVWRLVAKGHTNGEIAEALGISLDGAKWHVSELLVRLDVDTREDLVQAWDAQHRPATRLRNAFRALAAFSWPKAAGAGIAVGSVAVAGVVIAAAGSGSGTAAQETAGETATATPPSGGISTVLAEQEALSRAELEANRLILQHLLDYLVDKNFRLSHTQLISSKFVPAGTTYTTQDGTLQLVPSAVGAWAFSWLAEGEQLINGPLTGPADVRVEVVLADSAALEFHAEQAEARLMTGGIWTFGHTQGFDSHVSGELDHFQPAGDVFEITPPEGGSAGEHLYMYVARNGGVCTRHVFARGSGGGCGPSAGLVGPFAADDQVITVVGTGGGDGFPAGAQPPPPWLQVRLTPDAAWIAVQSADGTEDRFPAMEIPPALGLPYRIAYFTSPKLEEEHWFVAYDAAGNEIYRQGPWEPGNPPSYFLPRAN